MMSMTLLIIGMIVTVLLSLLAVYVVSKRLAKPFSGRMADEKEVLGKRMGAGRETSPSTQPRDADKKGPVRNGGFWSIVLTVVGAVVVYWEFQIPVAGIRAWSWGHWLPLLTGWGIVSLLISFNSNIFGTREKLLRRALSIAMAMLLVGIPIGGWIMSPSVGAPQRAVRSVIPLVSSAQSWQKLVIPAGGRSERIPVPPGMRIVMVGNRFLNHTVYQDGSECTFNIQKPCPNGAVVGNYATNETRETNIISYAFAPVH